MTALCRQTRRGAMTVGAYRLTGDASGGRPAAAAAGLAAPRTGQAFSASPAATSAAPASSLACGAWPRAIPRSEVVGLIKSLKDFTPKDKIAVPGIKTSLSAVILQMAAAKTFGDDSYDKLDALTVSLPHPEALASLLSGKTEITAHLTSPPFSYQELQDPKIHRVFDSAELLGNITLDVVFAAKRFVDENPKLTKAFMAAQEEANAFIAAHRKEAAETFLRVGKLKLTPAEVEKMLADKSTQFSTTPVGIMQYVHFMAKAGTIKNKPAVWTDMFVPAMQAKRGS